MFKNKTLSLVCILLIVAACPPALAAGPTHYRELLKEMFQKVTVEKNIDAVPHYYSKDFELTSNSKTENYADFLKQHRAIYQTSVQYKIRYDEKTFTEQGSKVAGRLFITTQRAKEKAREIEVILIAEYKQDKLWKVWELTFPDWTKMESFKDFS